MTEESWRDVPGYEGFYEVSNLGRVRNSRTRHVLKNTATQYRGGSYRYSVSLCKRGKQSTKKVHRLVAMAFIPNEGGKREVNHIDGNPLNNYAENLEWCTGSENMEHAYKNGLTVMSERRRKKIAEALGTHVVRDDGTVFESMTKAAQAIGCSVGEISAVVSGRRSTTHGYSFRRMGVE